MGPLLGPPILVSCALGSNNRQISCFLNFALNDCAAWSISFEESKEDTRAVILHSVLAPADTCSTRGVRLKVELWQLGIQIEWPKPHTCYEKNQNNGKMKK